MAPSGSSARIGNYVLGTKLQSTRTYEVWCSQNAESTSEPNQVMVKRLLPELSDNPRLAEQFALRGRRAKRLQHQGIEQVLDVVVEGDKCCIVSEFIEGQSLRDLMDRLHSCENALPVWFALYVARTICSALEYAHRCGDSSGLVDAIYHQDVGPETVIITNIGEVKLTDFGLARAALLGTEIRGTRRWSDSGEFDLWAPHFGDAQSDLLGFGKLFYELLAGKRPVKRYVPPSQHASWISHDLDQLVGSILGQAGQNRLTSALQIREALDSLIASRRQNVEASHLSALMRVVMTSCPNSQRDTIDYEVPESPTSRRPSTILPAAIIELTEEDIVAESVVPASVSVPNSQRTSRHDWDAAVESVRRTSLANSAPPPDPASGEASVATPAPSATQSFEFGLEQLRLGNLLAAETAWVRALELDPNHRLSQVNLTLLRKRRDSERPGAL